MTISDDLEGCADLDRLLAGTRDGEGGCLVLRGRPGAGRTTLIEYAVDRAGDMRPVRVGGAASETDFRFAALHQLLAPFLAGLDRLPAPQRHALRGVAGLAHGPDPNRFLVGLAVLTLLADAAADRPLLIVVDDAQWLDQASAEVLAFVARRLRDEPIAVVVAMRGPGPRGAPFAGLPGRYLGDRSAVAVVPRPRSAVSRSPHPAGRWRGRAHIVLAAAADPRPQPDQPRALAHATGPAAGATVSLLHDGIVVRDTEGYPAAVPLLQSVVTALLAEPGGTDSELLAMACTAAGELLDDGAQHAFADRWVRAERERSRPGSLPLALSALTRVDLLAGRLASAEANLAEARQAAAADGTPSATAATRVGELIVLAWRGRDDGLGDGQDGLGEGAARLGAYAGVIQSALTVLDLAAGRYPVALARALRIRHDDPLDHGTRILPDLVEAASRTGDRTAATASLDRLAERAGASGTPLALGLLARSRALLADGPAADGLYREAAAHLIRTTQAPQLARTRLLHGEWLRRRRRRREAREHLVAAAEMFEAMGMDAFAQRTRVELRATGEHVDRRTGELDDRLTPQEAQIARLVAGGLTNRDIATQLFISSSTVEYHLRKVFRKFAVTSRTQLARALLTANPPAAA
jgi:DNA-binding CsgD family transcriptional regulator